MRTAIIILLAFLGSPVLAEAVTDLNAPGFNHLSISEMQRTDSVSKNTLRIRPFDLEIIPPSSGVQFYRNGILFLSHSKQGEKIPERHLSFGSVRTHASLIEDTVPGSSISFELKGNALFPSEATTFSDDFNTMYLSLIPEKSSKEKIFKAEYTSDGWKIEEEPLAICNGDFIYSHPCLSADGTFLIFSSDQPGTNGGLDLWITRKKNDGWSNPENLGKQINSSGNELFAALDGSDNLYFSTDGHPGKGGYDIFLAGYNSSGWNEPHILPGGINTQDDELAFKIRKADGLTGFYTTRTRTGKVRTRLNMIDFEKVQSKSKNNSISDLLLAMAGEGKTVAIYQPVMTPQGPEAKKEVTPDTKMEVSAPANQVTEALAQETKKEITPEVKKEASPVAMPAAKTTPTPEKQESTKQESTTKTPAAQAARPAKDEIIYRVQIIANTKPVGSQNITIAGKTYKSFEYLYQGGYRSTIGEFGTLAEAGKLQSVCRQNGYSQAFVVAFKNNIRSTDPALFK